jgi:hypothetical protein
MIAYSFFQHGYVAIKRAGKKESAEDRLSTAA